MASFSVGAFNPNSESWKKLCMKIRKFFLGCTWRKFIARLFIRPRESSFFPHIKHITKT